MNRIILIGNGFDLAHELKTSYNDFMNDFWQNHFKKIKNKENLFAITNGYKYECNEFEINFYNYAPHLYKFEVFKDLIDSADISIVFKNKFLEIICEKHYTQNWVDIENEYYIILKSLLKLSDSNSYNIKKLNADFKIIQTSLKNYLKKIEENEEFESEYQNKVKKNIKENIYDRFYLKDFTEEILNRKVEEQLNKFNHTINLLEQNKVKLSNMSEEDQRVIGSLKLIDAENRLNYIKRFLLDDELSKNFDLKPDAILFLNFNYTKTEELYSLSYNNSLSVKTDTIHIHGELNGNINRDIIFGYGDEMDEDYKEIEKLNENEYLTNVKSMRYLENDNYKNLLNFINSDNYQVFIFGHSCGNSDRTLLNTLFEHKNCSSIKPFYHLKSSGEDNFTEIIKNISRNFNSKTKMRDVVVNKEYCKPLVF